MSAKDTTVKDLLVIARLVGVQPHELMIKPEDRVCARCRGPVED